MLQTKNKPQQSDPQFFYEACCCRHCIHALRGSSSVINVRPCAMLEKKKGARLSKDKGSKHKNVQKAAHTPKQQTAQEAWLNWRHRTTNHSSTTKETCSCTVESQTLSALRTYASLSRLCPGLSYWSLYLTTVASARGLQAHNSVKVRGATSSSSLWRALLLPAFPRCHRSTCVFFEWSNNGETEGTLCLL